MAFSLVQHLSQTGTTGTSTSVSFVSNNAKGNLLVCMARAVEASGSAPGTASISDNNGNVWNTAYSKVNSPSTYYLFYAMNSNAGANTVKLTQTNGGTLHFQVIIAEYSGVALSGALLATNTNGPLTQAGVLSGSIVVSSANPNTLLIAGVCNETANGQTFTSLGGGFAVEDSSSGNTFFTDSIKSAAGTFQMTGNYNGSNNWVAGIAAFLPPGAAGGNSSFVQGFRGFVNKRGMTSHLRPR